MNKHQDRFNKGWAISEADLDEDISLIKEIGARSFAARITSTAIIFTACATRPGILVWAEIPQVNEINTLGTI